MGGQAELSSLPIRRYTITIIIMEESNVERIPKPLLRGMKLVSMRRALFGSMITTTVTLFALKFLWLDPKWAEYHEFSRNYDHHTEWQRIKASGVASRVFRPDGTIVRPELESGSWGDEEEE